MIKRNLLRLSLGIALVASLFTAGCATGNTKDKLKAGALTDEPVVMIVINDPRGDSRKLGGNNPLYKAHITYENDPVLQRVSQRLLRDYKLTAREQWPLESLGVHCIVVKTPSEETLAQLKSDQRVAWVQDFNTFDTQTTRENLATGVKTTSTLNTIKTITPDIVLPNLAKGVKIMVVDTGAHISHPAFNKARVSYKNFVNSAGEAFEETHGTAITGLLGAQKTDANAPMHGLTQSASLYHYRGCWQKEDGRGKCSTLTLALALDAAVTIRPDIINLSLTGPPDPVLEALLNKLIQQGTIVVSAYDSQRSAKSRFPQSQRGVIYAYGSADQSNTSVQPLPGNTFRASSTALSLAPNNKYDIYTGHSIATPQVTAIVASLLAKDPSISNQTIAKRLEQWLTTP